MPMSKHEAGRRYLQASMNAGYTGLPDEHRQAHEDTMRQLERKHDDVRKRALAGADQDFDEPLAAGEREHQAHLRRQEGLTHGDVLRMRRELRGGTSQTAAPRQGARRSATSRSRRFARHVGRETGIAPTVEDTGSLGLKTLGILFGLALVYLIVNDEKGAQGPAAFAGLLNGITGLIRLVIAPVDPLGKATMEALSGKQPSSSSTGKATMEALSGKQPSSSSTSTSSRPERSLSSAIGGPKGSRLQARRLNPAFGPAPGIRTPLTALGG